MEYLKEVRETVAAIVPREAEVTSVDLEGPEIAVYTKNPRAFHDNEDYVKSIAHQLKKKVNIRSDKSLLIEEKDAREKIMQIVPPEAKIADIQFMEPFSEVVIEALKPGLVIGKQGSILNEIKSKTKKGSVFYTDGWKSYASLEQYGKHNVIDHDKELVDKNHNHINGIEGFWSFAKERFHKYHGISKTNYPLYVKEMEFRFNNRNENVFKLLMDICIVRGQFSPDLH